jgi:hypothetical protein
MDQSSNLAAIAAARLMSLPCVRLALRPLVAAAQQDHDHLAALGVVNAITGAVVDTHFNDATTDRFCIARVSGREPEQAHVDASGRGAILQAAKPVGKFSGATNVRHVRVCKPWFTFGQAGIFGRKNKPRHWRACWPPLTTALIQFTRQLRA